VKGRECERKRQINRMELTRSDGEAFNQDLNNEDDVEDEIPIAVKGNKINNKSFEPPPTANGNRVAVELTGEPTRKLQGLSIPGFFVYKEAVRGVRSVRYTAKRDKRVRTMFTCRLYSNVEGTTRSFFGPKSITSVLVVVPTKVEAGNIHAVASANLRTKIESLFNEHGGAASSRDQFSNAPSTPSSAAPLCGDAAIPSVGFASASSSSSALSSVSARVSCTHDKSDVCMYCFGVADSRLETPSSTTSTGPPSSRPKRDRVPMQRFTLGTRRFVRPRLAEPIAQTQPDPLALSEKLAELAEEQAKQGMPQTDPLALSEKLVELAEAHPEIGEVLRRAASTLAGQEARIGELALEAVGIVSEIRLHLNTQAFKGGVLGSAPGECV